MGAFRKSPPKRVPAMATHLTPDDCEVIAPVHGAGKRQTQIADGLGPPESTTSCKLPQNSNRNGYQAATLIKPGGNTFRGDPNPNPQSLSGRLARPARIGSNCYPPETLELPGDSVCRKCYTPRGPKSGVLPHENGLFLSAQGITSCRPCHSLS